MSHKPLAASREGRRLRIVLVRVWIGAFSEIRGGGLFGFLLRGSGDDVAIPGDGFKKGVPASLAGAA